MSASDVLQRVVPVIVTLLDDAVPVVRAAAVRCLRALLAPVQSMSALESNIFPLYIFPALSRVSHDSEVCSYVLDDFV